jgi:hypothetical protein
MALDQKDFEVIERLVYKNADDIAISIARSFERLEEHVDAAESRIHSRIVEVDDRLESNRQDIADQIGDVRSELRQFAEVKGSDE